jgi:hypothetical protein
MDTLGKKGTVNLVKISRNYNPVTGTETSSESVYKLSGVNVAVPSDLVDGEKVKLTDRLVVIDNAREPDISDLIRIDGKDYRIISISVSKHADVVQSYRVVCRG